MPPKQKVVPEINQLTQIIHSEVKKNEKNIIKFFRDIVAIPSMDSKIGPVGKRIQQEMKKLGFDKTWFDKMGNIVGQIGKGSKVLLYDSHIDTVGLGDPDAWKWDPFKGKVENGILFGRGACDEKCSTPGMVYGLSLAKKLGLLDGWTAFYFGNMEEWCDGIAPNSLHVTHKIKPDYVVIGEPTRMQIYRGHRGRLELKCITRGKSCHASMPWLGDNAIYKMNRFIKSVEDLGLKIHEDKFLGRGTCVASIIRCDSPSINAVPDRCVLYLDRRMTFGETKESVLKQLRELPGAEVVDIQEMYYTDPSYTKFVFKVDKYFPAWCLPEDHPIVQAGISTRKVLGFDRKYPFAEDLKQKYPEAYAQSKEDTFRWDFSTNATYWAGKANIPCIGFAPSNEAHAHTTEDQCPLEDCVDATAFYALFPLILRNKTVGI